MQEIKINHITFTGPESWSEFTRENLLDLARALENKSCDKQLVDFTLICKLFNIPYSVSKYIQEFQFFQLSEVLDFLYLENTLSSWLIKKIRIGLTNYSGPADLLGDFTADQFIQAEGYFERYLKFNEEKYLDGLLGSLYSKGQFDSKKIAKLSKKFSKLPSYVKAAVYLNYTGCRNLIIKAHPNIWAKGSGSGQFQITNWLDNLISVSGGALGELKNVRSENIWIVLRHMDKMAKEAKKR